ncbi:hypothetical protein E4U32_005586 [Claviceps aff. humidiphila group G2b]|nr:hypothetical protein E4U32_005586 [Claviceps aff. humidiphila group G2b]
MDMSSKACSGRHLAARDIKGRTWHENVAHVFRSCMVHYSRNIDQAVGRNNNSPHKRRMQELATARNRAEYLSIIMELRTYGTNWRHKLITLQRESNKKRKQRECDNEVESIQRNANLQGNENSVVPEAELEMMHPSGATYPDAYNAAAANTRRNTARRNAAKRNTASRNAASPTPASPSSAPRNSSPLAGRDRTDPPTPAQPAGFSPAPSQGRDNNGISRVALFLLHWNKPS